MDKHSKKYQDKVLMGAELRDTLIKAIINIQYNCYIRLIYMFLTDLKKLKVTVNIMLLFKTQGKITENDDKTNITHRFNVPENIKSLKIKYRQRQWR